MVTHFLKSSINRPQIEHVSCSQSHIISGDAAIEQIGEENISKSIKKREAGMVVTGCRHGQGRAVVVPIICN